MRSKEEIDQEYSKYSLLYGDKHFQFAELKKAMKYNEWEEELAKLHSRMLDLQAEARAFNYITQELAKEVEKRAQYQPAQDINAILDKLEGGVIDEDEVCEVSHESH